jgi:hypothetical protein
MLDESQIIDGIEFIWLSVAIKSEAKGIVSTSILKKRIIFVVQRLTYLYVIIKAYDINSLSTEGGWSI